MSRLRQFSRVAVIGLASLSGAYLAYNHVRKPALAAPLDSTSDDRDFRTRLSMLYKPSFQQWDSNWDMCESNGKRRKKEDKRKEDNTDNEPDIKPTAKRHLIFIRHGQYMDGKENDEDRVLTEIGRIQADLTGKRLKALNKPLTKIIVSDMMRAQQTAELIFKHLPDVPHETCSLLREGAPIPPDPPSSNWRPDKTAGFATGVGLHRSRDPFLRISEKKFFQDSARIEAAFRKHVHRADNMQTGDTVEVYICHANVIRYFVCRALQFPPEGWLRMSIGHCGITTMTVRPNGRVSLQSLGDIGHLPPEYIS